MTSMRVASTPAAAPTWSPAQHPASRLLQRSCGCGGAASLSGKCEACEHNERAQRRTLSDAGPIGNGSRQGQQAAEQGGPAGAPPIVDAVLAGPGRPMDRATQRSMEQRFGYDFSRVRIHTDSEAGRSARQVNARAYTVNSHIVFGEGEYRPGTEASDRLVAHELVHVIQQGGSLRRSDADAGEHETLERTPVGPVTPVSAGRLSRKNMFDCAAMGVPCPPAILWPETCRLVDCVRAVTANLPFAISPGICIFVCESGQTCACVLVGTSADAICTFRFCSRGRNIVSQADAESFAADAVAAAGDQLTPGSPQDATAGAAPNMQAKLVVNSAGDPYEQEADRIADQVMRMGGARAQAGMPPRTPPARRPFGIAAGDSGAAERLQRLSYSPIFDDSGEMPGAQTGTTSTAAEIPQEGATEPDSNGTVQMLQRAPADFGDGTPGTDNRSQTGEPPGVTSSTLPYRQATDLFECIRIMGQDNAAWCRHEVLGDPMPSVPPPPLCVPDTALTWADYSGTPPAKSPFAADTHFHHARAQAGGDSIQALFDGAQSWVKPAVANPANRSATQCGSLVSTCSRWLQQNPGSPWSLGAQTGCAAAIMWDTTLAATTAAECSSVIGGECDRVAALESARVLMHEQYHFKLACVLAQKGTAALRAGSRRTPDQMRALVAARASALTSRYDAETAHGCNAAAQSKWQTDIDNGLPAVTIA